MVLLSCAWMHGQQTQTQAAPDFATNSRYLQGYGGGGYAPHCTSASGKCPGSDLVLHIAAGTTNCSNTLVEYPAGTLPMTNSTTNYISLDPAASCAPTKSTSGFTFGQIMLYKVVTSGGVIQSIDDVRTPFAVSQFQVTGNTAVLASWSGAATAARCVRIDASGNLVAAAADCGSGAGNVTGSSLTLHALILGAGSSAISALGSLGTTTTLLHGNASGDPSFGAIVSADLPANTLIRGIPFSVGIPGGTALTAGANDVDYITVPFACTIAGYDLAVDAGTVTVKFWKKATGTAIPTSSDSISTAGVGISTGTAIQSTTTSDFTTTAVSAKDVMAMKVTAVSSAAYVQGVLPCTQ